MSVKMIAAEDLRHMEESEGLILRGCGGDLDEWVNGINEDLTSQGILLDGTRLQNCVAFEYEGLTCILFPFAGAMINVGKLAMWRLVTRDDYGSIWLSDFVPNELGGFLSGEPKEPAKPDCALIGQDGNIFNLMGIASATLQKNGMAEQAKEMCAKIKKADSYEKALSILGEYVNIV